MGTVLVASEALVKTVKDEMRKEQALVDELRFVGPRQLRGRENETVVYALEAAQQRAA
jgi:hypothetical protein